MSDIFLVPIVSLVVMAGFAIGFAGMDALFGQPLLGKWWRKNK